MPTYKPPYSKLIFITSADNERANNFSFWIYQRLKYADFPVCTYYVDEAPGAGGFTDRCIERADPVIVVLSNTVTGFDQAIHDLEIAQEKGKDIFLAIFEDVDMPKRFQQWKIFDFRLTQEQTFEELHEALAKKEYFDKPHWESNGEEALKQARFYVRQKADTPNKEFYITYYYLQVFQNLYEFETKVLAIRDFAQMQMMSGILLAELADDYYEVVRGEAALALAKFNDDSFILPLKRAFHNDATTKVRLYAQTALAYMEDHKIVFDIISAFKAMLTTNDEVNIQSDDLSDNYDLTPSLSFDSTNYSLFISYARKDAEFLALDLTHRLETEGFDVWIDTKLEPGTSLWTREVERSILRSSLVLVLVSPAIHESEWVAREVEFAREHGKEIVPIIALNTHKPIYLNTHQGLRGNPIFNENPDRVVDSLVATIKKRNTS